MADQSSFEGKKTRRSRVLIFGAAPLALAILSVYSFYPRHADLRQFDPIRLSQLEAQTWRDYYERRYFSLLYRLYEIARANQFSPASSAALAIDAGMAAHSFQASSSNTEADSALPALVRYFRILSAATTSQFNIDQAARTELRWWQMRREGTPPEQYGLIISQVWELLYAVDNDDLHKAGILRAQAMSYRDAHGSAMSDEEWQVVASKLATAYRLLKVAIAEVQTTAPHRSMWS